MEKVCVGGEFLDCHGALPSEFSGKYCCECSVCVCVCVCVCVFVYVSVYSVCWS